MMKGNDRWKGPNHTCGEYSKGSQQIASSQKTKNKTKKTKKKKKINVAPRNS